MMRVEVAVNLTENDRALLCAVYTFTQRHQEAPMLPNLGAQHIDSDAGRAMIRLRTFELVRVQADTVFLTVAGNNIARRLVDLAAQQARKVA